MTTATRTSLALSSSLIALLALPAFAHEGDHTGIDMATHLEAAPLARPLDAVRARAQEIKENALRPSASMTPAGLPTPLRLEERPINARVVETATSSPRGSFIAIVRTHIGGIKNRLENVLGHLSRFLTRAESRLEKMEAAGMEVTGIASLLADAEVAIELAETDVAAIGASVGSDDERTTIRTAISADVRVAQESVRLAREAVRRVVTALVAAAQDAASADVEAETAIEIE